MLSSLQLFSIPAMLLVLFAMKAEADSSAGGEISFGELVRRANVTSQAEKRSLAKRTYFPPIPPPTDPFCTPNYNSAWLGDLLPCYGGKTTRIRKIDCMKALEEFQIVDKYRPYPVYPQEGVKYHGTCKLSIRANVPINDPRVRLMFNHRYGTGIEAFFDTCCPKGFWVNVTDLGDPATNGWVRISVTAPNPHMGSIGRGH